MPKHPAEHANAKPPAVFLMGPTAAGKTDLAIKLCQHYPFEIISVDSALVYQGMNIGTAKPSAAELTQAPHHLIDFQDPASPYTVANFVEDATQLMEDITGRGKTPLLVGGTMMYFKALLQGMTQLPGANEAIRTKLAARAEQEGWPALHQQLQAVDPKAAQRIHPNDSQRIQRALEVYESSGRSLSDWQQAENTINTVSNIKNSGQTDSDKAQVKKRPNQDNQPWSEENRHNFPYNVVCLALCPVERKTLHARIEQRFKLMLEQGLLDEVSALYQRGDLSPELPAIRAVGYRQVWDYLAGNIDYETMVERGIIATRQLAKRQLTWLRSWPDINWLHTDDEAALWRETVKLVVES